MNFKEMSLKEVKEKITNFDKVPRQQRMMVFCSIKENLERLNESISVSENNPITDYGYERIKIIRDTDLYEVVSSYKDILSENLDDFNFQIYNKLTLLCDNEKNVSKRRDIINKVNIYADNLIKSEYPELKDQVDIALLAGRNISIGMRCDSNNIVYESLEDIAFVMGMEELSCYHIRRVLLDALNIINEDLFCCVVDQGISKKIVDIFNTQYKIIQYDAQQSLIIKTYSKERIDEYLRMKKKYHETILLSGSVDSSYTLNTFKRCVNEEQIQMIVDHYLNPKFNLDISLSNLEIFKLKQNKFENLSLVKNYVVYSTEKNDYVIFINKNNKNEFVFASRIGKVFKVDLKESESNNEDLTHILESAMFIKE